MTNPDLIERYLNAVKFWLPKAQQRDILAELAEDLRSQIEEREAALGRPLAESDLVDLLKRRGAPMRVASGYLPEQRLIAPAMLPIYRLVLKIVLLWVLAPLFVIVSIGPIFNSERPGLALLHFFVECWRGGFFAVGIVTVIFALLDRYHAKFVDKWDPRRLPRVPRPHETSARTNDTAGFVFGLVALVFWADLMWQRGEFDFPGGLRFVLNPVWQRVYWAVLGLTLARACADLVGFLRPIWTRTRSSIRLGLAAANILMAGLLLKVGNWVEISGPNVSAADAAKATAWVNHGIRMTLITVAAITLFDAVRQLRLLLRAKPQSDGGGGAQGSGPLTAGRQKVPC